MERIQFVTLALWAIVQLQERVHCINKDKLGTHGLDPLIEESQQSIDGELA